MHRIRDMIDLMDKTAKDIIKGKKAAIQGGNLESQENMQTGTDIISVLRAFLFFVPSACSYSLNMESEAI
jgi:hypothetical protein